MGAEEDGATAVRAGHAGEQVAGFGAGVAGGVVLLDLEAEALQLRTDGLGHLALAPRGTLDLAEADEVVQQALALLRGGGGRRGETTGPAGTRNVGQQS